MKHVPSWTWRGAGVGRDSALRDRAMQTAVGSRKQQCAAQVQDRLGADVRPQVVVASE